MTDNASSIAQRSLGMLRVIIESPFAGNSESRLLTHHLYAKQCLHDSIMRGEAPFASHLLYPQVLDDKDSWSRETGIAAGIAWRDTADRIAVYTDLGWSSGMKIAIELSGRSGIPTENRSIGRNKFEEFVLHLHERAERDYCMEQYGNASGRRHPEPYGVKPEHEARYESSETPDTGQEKSALEDIKAIDTP